MKFGQFEGSPEEFRDIVENHGLQIEEYFEKPIGPLKGRCLIAPCLLFVISLLVIVFLDKSLPIKYVTTLYLLAFGFGIWLVVCVQLCYRHKYAAIIVSIGLLLMLLILLISTGMISPQDTVDLIKELK